MKRKLLAIVLMAAMVMSLAACGASAPAEPAAEPEAEAPAAEEAEAEAPAAEDTAKELNITWLSPSTESEYWQYNEIGMRNAIIDLEEQYGCKINFEVTGPATEAETESYLSTFENVISKHPDAIITATLATDATIPVAKECTDAGILLNFVGCGIELIGSTQYNDYYNHFWTTNSDDIGTVAAEYMIQNLKDSGRELKGTIGINMSVIVESLEPRMDAFKAYMAENAPDIVCTDTLYNQNEAEQAQSNAETQISTYGDDLIGLYGCNNISGDGIALAIQGAGIQDKVVGIAVDSDGLEIEALGNGGLDAIIAQPPYEHGYKAMTNAVTKLLTGEDTESEKIVVIKPVAVTKDMMEDPEYYGLLDPTTLKNY